MIQIKDYKLSKESLSITKIIFQSLHFPFLNQIQDTKSFLGCRIRKVGISEKWYWYCDIIVILFRSDSLLKINKCV